MMGYQYSVQTIVHHQAGPGIVLIESRTLVDTGLVVLLTAVQAGGQGRVEEAMCEHPLSWDEE